MATFDLATLRTITLLYIEDEEMIRNQSLKAYNKLFKKVFPAEDGEEALKIFEEHKSEIDVVVTDINMPKISGLEFAKKISEVSTIPILITSAYTNTEYLLEAIDTGVKGYLTKPVTLNGIVQDIERVVVRYRKDNNIKNIAKTLLTKEKDTNITLSTLQEENIKLRNENAIYKSLVEKYIYKIQIDKNGLILQTSSSISKLIGYTQEELVGQNISILKDISCESVPFQKQMLEAIHKKQQITTSHTLKTKDGKLLDFEISMVLSYSSDALVSGYTLYLNLKM
jgi:PAS domain S-box-containing protein